MLLEIVPSPADGIAAIQLDNISVEYRDDLTLTETSCIASNLPPSGNLAAQPRRSIRAPTGWTFWGEIGYAWNPRGDVSFWRQTPSPFGAAIYQDLAYTTLANAPFEVTADLANDSAVTKDVWLTLRSPDWTDYFNCRFTLDPYTPMTNLHDARAQHDRLVGHSAGDRAGSCRRYPGGARGQRHRRTQTEPATRS